MKSAQKGVALIIALIALVAMSLAALSLMRSVDTSNQIAGNLSFSQASAQMLDVGQDTAVTDIQSFTYSNPQSCESTPANCPSYYYPDSLCLDPVSKIPAPANSIMSSGAIAGTSPTCAAGSVVSTPPVLSWSAAITNATTGYSNLPSGYSVSYVIERMCQGTSGGVAYFSKCMATPKYVSNVTGIATGGGGSGVTAVPTVTVDPPPNPCKLVSGSCSTATVTATIGSGVVTGLTITSPGAGYSYLTPPTLTFTGASGVASTTAVDGTGALVISAQMPAQQQGILYFRVTVQVIGPKNTISHAQYFVGNPDTVL